MKITVNKCPYTGELFESDKKYAAHLARLRRDRAKVKAEERLRATFFDWLDAEKLKITNVDMIAPWLLANQRKIMDAVNAGVRPRSGTCFGFSSSDKFYDTDEVTTFVFESARYAKSISNSHNAPDNGVTNWGGRVEGAPRGYPGWECRVDGKTHRLKKHSGNYPTSTLLNLVGIKTGTGGGGNESWGYHAQLFLADWPGLQVWVDEYEMDQMATIIRGKKVAVTTL